MRRNNMCYPSIIARIRKEKGLTQSALAAAVGVRQKDISRWESGAIKPSIGTLMKLSVVFGCSIDSLIEE